MNKTLEPFRIRITREEEPEYSMYIYYSFYEINAPNFHDAEKEARKQFCSDFGAPYEKTKAYTFNKQQK